MFPVSGDPLYGAVRIETDADHAGDISFFSSADVTSNGRGISVGHYGRSGALRTEIAGGTFSIESEWPGAFAIHSYRGDAYRTGHGSSGDHDVIVRDVVVDLDGPWGGIVGVQGGEGNLNVAVQDSAIEVDSRLGYRHCRYPSRHRRRRHGGLEFRHNGSRLGMGRRHLWLSSRQPATATSS